MGILLMNLLLSAGMHASVTQASMMTTTMKAVYMKNIVFVGSSEVSSTSSASSTSATNAPESVTSTSTLSMSSSSNNPNSVTPSASGNTTVPVYSLDIPSDSGSSALKYLYLIFLIFVLVIIAIVVHLYVFKRRKARKLQERNLITNAALRRDLEQRASLGRPPVSDRSSPGSHSHQMEEVLPPYPSHAHIGMRLPVYDEVAEEDECDMTGSRTDPGSSVSLTNARNESTPYGQYDRQYGSLANLQTQTTEYPASQFPKYIQRDPSQHLQFDRQQPSRYSVTSSKYDRPENPSERPMSERPSFEFSNRYSFDQRTSEIYTGQAVATRRQSTHSLHLYSHSRDDLYSLQDSDTGSVGPVPDCVSALPIVVTHSGTASDRPHSSSSASSGVTLNANL